MSEEHCSLCGNPLPCESHGGGAMKQVRVLKPKPPRKPADDQPDRRTPSGKPMPN